jgi:hypothetical protein
VTVRVRRRSTRTMAVACTTGKRDALSGAFGRRTLPKKKKNRKKKVKKNLNKTLFLDTVDRMAFSGRLVDARPCSSVEECLSTEQEGS